MNAAHPLPRWFVIYAMVVSLFAVAALTLGVTGIFVDKSQNEADAAAGRTRDAETARLLECFDQYAAATSASSKTVRAATVVRDQADRRATRAFNALFAFILTGPAEGDPEGLRLFTELTRANADLEDAQVTLAVARRRNPVADPPSTFCNEDGGETSPSPSPTP